MQKDPVRIIDIHAHILPGIDDGAKNMEETYAMLQIAWKEGIRTIVATPHYNPSKAGGIAEIRELMKAVQAEAWNIDPDFSICHGNELFYLDGIVEDLKGGKALTLAGTSYVLIEFYRGISMRECVRAVRKVTMACYTPVIAHAERYLCLRNEGALEDLIRSGALIQMNFDSLTGPFLDKNVKWCRKAVKSGFVHLLGTDMHNTGDRSPKVHKAVKWMLKDLGRERTEELLWKNPDKILEGQYL